MRTFLKKLFRAVADKLESGEAPTPEPADPLDIHIPAWQPEIIEHPRYWVQTNYREVSTENLIYASLAEKAHRTGTAVDVMKIVHKDAVLLMFESIRTQLTREIPETEGVWRAFVKDDVLSVELLAHSPGGVPKLRTAWNTAAKKIRAHGILLGSFPITVRTERHKEVAMVTVPVKNVQLDITSPLLWSVLRQNKRSPIIWEGKLWIPTAT